MDDRFQKFILTHLTLTQDGMGQVSEHFAALLYGMAIAALDALLDAGKIGPFEAAAQRVELREALDKAHPGGFRHYLSLVAQPEDTHCTGHVDYDPDSRIPEAK